MDEQQQIFGLMAIAEEHQKAVAAAIAGLAAERAALAKERALLAQVAQGIQKATSDAVSAAVRQSLAGASETAAKALGDAAMPVIGKLSGVVQAASDAEDSMRKAGQWFAWKWVAVAGGGLAGVCLVAYVALAWQLHEVGSLSDEKARLAAAIVRERATVAGLDKAGGRVVWNTCGGRLCFEVSSNQGTYSNGTPLPLGSWTTNKRHVPLVIPKGY
jgi:hypothetical protein